MDHFQELEKSFLKETSEEKLKKIMKMMVQEHQSQARNQKQVTERVLRKLTSILTLDYSIAIKCLAYVMFSAICHYNEKNMTLLLRVGIFSRIKHNLNKMFAEKTNVFHSDSVYLTCLEQIVFLIQKLSLANNDFKIEMKKAGILELILQICDYQNPMFFAFQNQTKRIVQELIKGKHLVGLCADLDDETKSEIMTECFGESLVSYPEYAYSVELYDTSQSDVDLQIKDEVIKRGAAWPVIPIPQLKKQFAPQKEETVIPRKEEEIWTWKDVYISSVIHGNIVMAHMGQSSLFKVQAIQQSLASYCFTEVCQCLKLPPKVGQFVCAKSEESRVGYYRAKITHVSGSMAQIYSLDHGFLMEVPWNTLVYLTKEMDVGGVPPQATLLQLKGMSPPPVSLALLEYGVAALCNLCESYIIAESLIDIGALQVLIPLFQCPDKSIAKLAFGAVENMARGHLLRAMIGGKGVIKYLLDVCEAWIHDQHDHEQVLARCLFVLNNMLYRNKENTDFLSQNGLPILLRYTTSPVELVKNMALQVLRNFLGNTDIQAKIEQENKRQTEQTAMPRTSNFKSYESETEIRHSRPAAPASPQRRTRSGSRSRSRSRGRRQDRGRSVSREKGALGSLSRERLERHYSSSDEESPRKQYYTSGDDTDGEGVVANRAGAGNLSTTIDALSINDETSYYIQGMPVNINNDQCNEIWTVTQIRDIKKNKLSELICGLLNTGRGGSIFAGIDRATSAVRGIKVDRETRDGFRIGLDHLVVDNLVPVLMHSQFSVCYAPVVELEGHEDPDTRKIVQDTYVVEMLVKPSQGTVYTPDDGEFYLRVGGLNRCLTTQEVRKLALEQTAMKYIAEMDSLKAEINTLKRIRSA